MTLGQELIIFMMSIIIILFTLQAVDEIVTERKERIYKNIRNKARKEVRLQKEEKERINFIMGLR